jgi:hypothetical protein
MEGGVVMDTARNNDAAGITAEGMIAAMRLLADNPAITVEERRVRQHLVTQWEARLAAEDRRAGETAARVRELREKLEHSERDVAILLDKLRRWKKWFAEAILARRTLGALRAHGSRTVADALPIAEGVARSELEGRIDLTEGA